MRLFFLMPVIVLLSAVPAYAQGTASSGEPPGFECSLDIHVNRNIETLIMSVGCEGHEMSQEEVLSIALKALQTDGAKKAGLDAYTELRQAFAFQPIDGKSSVWGIMLIVPHAKPTI